MKSLLYMLIIFLTLMSMIDATDLRKDFMKALEKFTPSDGILQIGSPQVLKTRYKAYKSFYKMVEANNEDDGTDYQSEINRFSVETDEEIESNLGLNISMEDIEYLEKRGLHEFDPSVLADLEKRGDKVDHSDKLPAVKNQGKCGSCWTFGATAALEYQVNKYRTGGSVIALAEQEYLDCVYEEQRGKDGCKGGWPTKCYDFNNRVNHMATNSDYKYVGRDNKCNYKRYKNAIEGFTVGAGAEHVKGDAAMTIAVADRKIGVISCAIKVVTSLFGYKKGIYSDKSCDRSPNHAVDVVGYGVLGGVAYWRVRNSWGSGWGDGGYINMMRGTGGKNINMCRIAGYSHYPKVRGGSSDGGDDKEDDKKNEDDNEGEICIWRKSTKNQCEGYLSNKRMTLAEAQKKCETTEACVCVSCKYNTSRCYIRKREKLRHKSKYTSYICG